MTGPLAGITVIELAGIGPGPFTGMMLADMGARVIRVDRIPSGRAGAIDTMMRNDSLVDRGRESIALDLKNPRGVELVLSLLERADALFEGFRPGVLEELGLGPEVCQQRNPRLVIGRITGWGQTGPLARTAGHDINYVALSGALHAIGPDDRPPPPPLNLIGDYGGGGMLLLAGMLAALLEARSSGRGQVVDAAMLDGSAQLMSAQYALMAKGVWRPERGRNFLDGTAPFYRTYECADGRFVAIGSIEPQFYRELLQRCAIADPTFSRQWDEAAWPDQRSALEALFLTRTRDEWCGLLEGSDVCFAPVLSMTEAPGHPHNSARQGFLNRDGHVLPAPAPRFSRTQSALAPAAPPIGQDGHGLLREIGMGDEEIARLVADRVVYVARAGAVS